MNGPGRWSGWLALALAMPVAAQDTSAKMQAEIDELRATVKALQAQVHALQASPPATGQVSATAPPAVPTAGTAGHSRQTATPVPSSSVAPATLVTEAPAQPARQSVSDNPTGASRIDNEAPPTNPDLAGFFHVPDSQTILRLGGYTKLDAIYDKSAIGNTEQFVLPSIPVPRTPYDNGNFNLHARQTRLSFEVRHPTVFDSSMRFYLESDFYGGSSGQYQLRLRQAFGQLGNTFAGYGYSVFMDPDALPDTLDFAGPGAALFVQQPGVHQAFHLGDSGSLTVSLERPSSEVSREAPGPAVRGTQHFPDAAIAVRTERPWGHLQASGVLRQLGYDDGERTDRSVAGGLALSGGMALGGPAEHADLLLFSGVWGKGIAHYGSELGGSGLDAAVDAAGRVHPLRTWGAYAAYTHYWNADWRSNLVYGQNHVETSPWLADTAFRQSNYGAMNLLWSPAATLTMGMELIYGRFEQQDGESNHSARIQGSLQYNFIR